MIFVFFFEIYFLNYVFNMFISLNFYFVWVFVICLGLRCKYMNICYSRVSYKGSEEIIFFNYYVKL